MRERRFAVGVGFIVLAAGLLPAATVRAQGLCQSVSFEGEATAGQSYEKILGGGLKLELEAVRAGWILRVLPVKGPRPAHDAAELATPPYNSVTPLALTTDYSFRAQDVVAWNPRHFQFAADAKSFGQLQSVYVSYMASLKGAPGTQTADPAVEGKLAELVTTMPVGDLQILDAKIVPGAANQAQMAAAVASHFANTPHSVEQAEKPDALGRLSWVKFRIKLQLPADFSSAPALKADRKGCK